ncbi:MAG: 5-formyltetrahydrofolate cyclo-ligase [Blastocatellia bacterium]
MKKDELRKLFLAKRLAIESEKRKSLSAEMAAVLFREVEFRGVSAVHCFLSLEKNGEPQTAPILERIWRDYPNIRTFAPRINPATGAIDSVEITSETPLSTNRWGIPEPPEGKSADSELFDCVIVPLICSDKAGHRVGYGKGFYDRFLTRCRRDCKKVGLSFFPPVDKILDVHQGDIQLDLCITPAGIYRFKPNFAFSANP